MRLEIKDPLTDAQWQAVETAALQVLQRTGLKVAHDEVLQVLGKKKGMRVDAHRVRIERSCILDTIRAVKGTAAYDTRVIAGAYSHNYLDPATGQVRRPTLQDLISSVRQADALGAGVCAPVVPLDVPGPRQELVMERVTHENCRFSYGGGQATTAAAAEAAIEMSAVVNRPNELEIWITSPLVLDPTGLDILWKLRHRRPRVRISNMPVRGMTGPISLAGMLALTAAECFGAAAVLRSLDVASSITYRVDAFWAYAMDMHTANVLLSGPDYMRLMTLSVFLGKRYGIEKPMAKVLLTASKKPDQQAAAEKAAQALAAVLMGSGTFAASGALSQVEIFSPIQMVIDQEIVSWADAYARDLDFVEEDLSVDEIDQVGPGGTFLDRESTARRMREAYWPPKLFSFNAFPAWVEEGEPELAQKAMEILDSLPVAEGPVVSSEQQRELAAIEEKFAAML